MAVPPLQRAHLRQMAVDAGEALADAPPADILSWASDTVGDRLAITASMADAVLIDVAARVVPGVHVIFLDTGYHFAQTLKTRDEVAARYDITLHTVAPRQTVPEQDALFGPQLHDRDPDACCSLRKVEPLHRALEPFHAWASGMRRDESPTRRAVRTVEWDEKRSMIKLNPLATWTQDQVDAYIIDNDVAVNDLVYDGFPSIGCAPCTSRPAPGSDPRSGRWAGRGKTECGLHLDSVDTATPLPMVRTTRA